MSKFYNKTDYLKYANQQVTNYQDAIKAVKVIIEATKAFDGKVINIRLQKAVNEAFKNAGMPYTSFYLKSDYSTMMYCRDSDSYRNEADTHGYRSTSYIDYTYYLPEIARGDRYNYSEMKEKLYNTMSTISENMFSLMKDIENIDLIEAKYNLLKSDIDDFNDSITSETKQLYSIVRIY
jgi:hypothetical protein